MKKLLTLVILFVGLVFVASPVMAADENITCSSSGCTPSAITHFFPSSELWYPGHTMTKTIQITNTSGSSQKIGAESNNESTTGGVDEVMNMEITRSDASIAWTGTLKEFYANGETELMSSLGTGSNETFAFKVTMDIDAGNEYQDTSTQFDLVFGFIAQPKGKTTSLTTSCTGTNFDAIVELKDNDVVQSGIKVKFTYKGEVLYGTTDSNGKTSVGYGYTGDDNVKAEPENGHPSETVMIRSTDCKTSSSSSSESVLGAATRFFTTFTGGQVAGAATSSSSSSKASAVTTETGEVKGATTKCNCIWWQILLGEAGLVVLCFFIGKNLSNKKILLSAIVKGIIAFAIFRYLNRCFGFDYFILADTPSFFCRYFVAFAFAISLSGAFIHARIASNKSEPS